MPEKADLANQMKDWERGVRGHIATVAIAPTIDCCFWHDSRRATGTRKIWRTDLGLILG
jgi:hypothetical protein